MQQVLISAHFGETGESGSEDKYTGICHYGLFYHPFLEEFFANFLD
jgi:hypothetical protein